MPPASNWDNDRGDDRFSAHKSPKDYFFHGSTAWRWLSRSWIVFAVTFTAVLILLFVFR